MRYGEAFWRQGPKTFSEEAWKRINTRVEVKEKRLNEVRHEPFFPVDEVSCSSLLYCSVVRC